MRSRFLATIFLVMLIAGCSQTSQTSYVDVYKGTEGLVFDFIKDFPPVKVFEGSSLTLGLKLENKGASDITDGTIAVSLEKDYMRISSWDLDSVRSAKLNTASFSIKGKSGANPKGEIKILTSSLESLTLERQTETHTSNIVVTACYQYKTHFEQDICVDTDIFGMSIKEKNCQVNAISSSGQGAPLAVTKVEQKMAPHADRELVVPEFIVYIKNVGKGEIVDSAITKTTCSSSPVNKEELNRIKVDASLGEYTLQCSPADFHLSQERDFVICKLPGGLSKAKGTYMTPLIINMEYGYTESISKRVEIRRLG